MIIIIENGVKNKKKEETLSPQNTESNRSPSLKVW